MSKFQHLQSNQEKKVINFKAYIASSILNRVKFVFKSPFFQGTWVAQLVMRPTLDFGSGHDLTVHGIEPCVRLCADSTKPALGSISPSLSVLPLIPCTSTCARSLAFKYNIFLKMHEFWGAWVAQLVGLLTSAQVMISWV